MNLAVQDQSILLGVLVSLGGWLQGLTMGHKVAVNGWVDSGWVIGVSSLMGKSQSWVVGVGETGVIGQMVEDSQIQLKKDEPSPQIKVC